MNAQALRRSTVFIIAAAFGLAAWAIMFHRVFNAPQILTSLLQRILIILAWVGGLQLCLLLLGGMSAPYDVLFISVAAISAVVFYLDRESRTWLQLGGERELAQLRSAILSLGRSESDQARLVPGCEDLVCKRYGARFAELLVDGGAVFGGMRMRLPKGSAAFAGLAHAGWATPEALERQRTTPETQELNRFLHENSIAAIVAVPRGSPTPSLLIALGEKNDGWPVTYPEIERLTNVAELIDNVLLHARLAAEAALKAQVEHLAMMSRGLAHDLKNLITPISSFLIHAEPRIIAGTVEAEVHDSASRSVAIINDYISEALFFGTRLELRLEPTAVPALVQTVMNITASRAARRRVTVVSQPIEGQAHIDRVLIQRMLANLVNNAIDASKPGTMVTLSATRAGMGLQFAVADSGSGISAENRARIFEPYFTTKQMGDDARGFGLGLTICDKVVRLHGGIIRVESEPGRGTTMTVEFPSAFAPVRPATVAGNAPTTVMHAQSS
ncbi:MAG: HAMP domain-containing sensor histidine kinase [Opitutaceae bacterium]|nr:HAMP domain-containing sensor histidine kinase [Opitutaceae bacterium]